jgi:AraC family transcriptional regulator
MVSTQKSFVYERRLSRVCDYIQQNLNEDFTLEGLSALAHFSKYHFNRVFAAYVGVSVFRFILLMRLKRASYSLAFKKDVKIIDIAFDAKFENPESFSRAFKNAFGCSPSQFRKKPQWPHWQDTLKVMTPIVTGDLKMEVRVVDFPETRVAVLEHRGAPEKVMESVEKFIAWRKESKLSPIATSSNYGVAYDDPMATKPEDFRFDLCGSVEGDVPTNVQGVKASVIPGGRCAMFRHHGAHEKMDDKIRALYRDWLPQSGEELRDFPCFFHYHNLAWQVEEHELITDIYLPLR